MFKKTLISLAAEAASEPTANAFAQAIQINGWGGEIVVDVLSFALVLGVMAYAKLQVMDARTQRDRIILNLVDLV
jgi:hypothetical protein